MQDKYTVPEGVTLAVSGLDGDVAKEQALLQSVEEFRAKKALIRSLRLPPEIIPVVSLAELQLVENTVQQLRNNHIPYQFSLTYQESTDIEGNTVITGVSFHINEQEFVLLQR